MNPLLESPIKTLPLEFQNPGTALQKRFTLHGDAVEGAVEGVAGHPNQDGLAQFL